MPPTYKSAGQLAQQKFADVPNIPDEAPRIYEVRLTEPAEIEIETEHGRLAELVSQEYADRWQDGLLAEINRLALFPASHEIARENERYDVEVRRTLYYGPSKRRRRGGAIYRILFYVVEPVEGETRGLVRVLHVWHGAKRPIG